MNMLSKVLGGIFTVFFIYAVIVQFNDVDALLWIMLYAIAAFLSVLFTLGKLKKIWPLVLAIVYIGLAIYHWPPEFEGVALQDGMKTINIELGRESLGMGISALVMVVYAFLIKKKS